jgi:transcriptional regulator with XRE-family HTH domain
MTLAELKNTLMLQARRAVVSGQYTERELAERLSISREWTCKILSGRHKPSYTLILRIATVLGIDVMDLIKGTRLEALRTPLMRPAAKAAAIAPITTTRVSLRVLDEENE